MWTIRQDQVETFAQEHRHRFEDQMIPFLAKYFPEQCKKLGDTKIRQFIRYGITRAASYGVVRERDVCQYICLMFIFGGDFDRDSRLRHVRKILSDRTPRRSGALIKNLYAAATRDLRRWQREGRPEWRGNV